MIRQYSTLAELCSLESDWRELCLRTQATPFQSPDWLLPWTEHLFRGGTLWTIGSWKDERLAGLAPMFIYGDRQVALIGAGLSDYAGFLCTSLDDAHEIWREILHQRDRWRLCDFQDIPAGSRMLELPPGMTADIVPCAHCPVVALPASIEQFEASLSPKFRHNLRNASNRLRDMGATFETSSSDEFIDALFRLNTARWSTKGEAGVLAPSEAQNFFRSACARLSAHDRLRFHGLRWRGELHAVVCIFCAPRGHQYYLGGFTAELARYSPGASMIRYAIEHAIAEGKSEFDFLRGGERYKTDWGAIDQMSSRIILNG